MRMKYIELQDKDVALLWQRDTTKDKRKYIGEVGEVFNAFRGPKL